MSRRRLLSDAADLGARRRLDTDGDGQLDADEIRRAVLPTNSAFSLGDALRQLGGGRYSRDVVTSAILELDRSGKLQDVRVLRKKDKIYMKLAGSDASPHEARRTPHAARRTPHGPTPHVTRRPSCPN